MKKLPNDYRIDACVRDQRKRKIPTYGQYIARTTEAERDKVADRYAEDKKKRRHN